MSKGISVSDLERMVGQKADKITPYVFDPETGCFERRVIFKLKRKRTQPPTRGEKQT
jgi:hypothetical protein